jgi:hypothetical protein
VALGSAKCRINRAIPETELDDFVSGFVNRVLSFDGQASATANQRLNRTFMPDPGQWRPRGPRSSTSSPFELDVGLAIAEL